MDRVERIKQLLANVPPKLQEAGEILSAGEFTKEELATIAIDVTDSCFCEYRDAMDPRETQVTINTMHSTYLLSTLQLLLDHGLDPNTVIDDENILWNIEYVDAPNVGAAALRLLLENGGNSNHFLPAEGETIFDYVDFEVSYDRYTHDCLNTVQFWLVLMAYGGCYRDGGIPLTMLGDNKVDIFKSFEEFDYWIEPLPQEPGKYGCWIMHIFRIEDNEEVARFE